MYDPNQKEHQPENQQNYQYPIVPPVYTYIQPPTPPGQGAAIAGFILSLVSLVLCCAPLYIPGIICSIVALAKGNRGGMAVAGLVIGIICLLVSVLLIFIPMLGMDSGSTEWFSDYFNNYYYS